MDTRSKEIETGNEIAFRWVREGSYRAVAEAVGLNPERDAPLLWKVHKGHAVRASTLKRIRRALGLEPPPRKLHRPVVSAEEWQLFQEWKAARQCQG